jgi:hypothetical protein
MAVALLTALVGGMPAIILVPAPAQAQSPAPATYTVTGTGGIGLNERLDASTSKPPVGRLADGDQVVVMCQRMGELVGSNGVSSAIWNLTSAHVYVSDLWLTTPGVGVFTPSLPQCADVQVSTMPSVNACGQTVVQPNPGTDPFGAFDALTDDAYASMRICGFARELVNAAPRLIIRAVGAGRVLACAKVLVNENDQSLLGRLKLTRDAVTCLAT